MRKLVSLGLFALTLSMFSSQVLASNVAACDEVKKAKKGLYGLCVAWHNADEEGKNEIAQKYRDRTGGDEVPGSSTVFSCPCWSGVVLSEIGEVTSPDECVYYQDRGDYMALFGGSDAQQDFLTNGVDCGYMGNYVDLEGSDVFSFEFKLGMDPANNSCAQEMAQIVKKYFDSNCDLR
jgi:hypothetical protein